jgi:uncharacterized membrane protein
MALFYVAAGVAHFIVPDTYERMIPPIFPAKSAIVILSGLAEIALGLGLCWPKRRRAAAFGIIALLVLVFPANVYVALHDIPLFGAERGAGLGNWLRLPVQGLLIAWAWLYTRSTDPKRAP